ncbi:zinc knuckle (CCHC-type) family protein [Striga asiatica]|uniref:Zinc knuckle (CCHC-type) family protein n=1 Tax=Striga asiatica TaxID=4170 RepID=A0A5A7PCL2_STRAF|nr:zinc knuckle (CCHC-type) family protein [Striga asiatica]
MTSAEDVDAYDDFSEIYKAYTGPVTSNPPKEQDKTLKKRSHAGSDEEEEEAHDPNAVPTDFTSREAKVWEAKSKATERNWKKRKEEEMICKICGESGHFTQGCPSTLGANRKSQDFFERVPARDPQVRSLFSKDVVNKIEKDIGCKIKMDEKFIIVSGKDRLILRKGVDAVHKIKEDGEKKGSSSSPVTHAKSLEHRSPLNSRTGRKSNSSPHSSQHIPHRYGRQERVMEDHVRQDIQKLSNGSPNARGKFLGSSAYGSDGVRGRASRSKSPRPSYFGNSYNNSFEGHTHNRGGIKTDGWNSDRGKPIVQSDNFDYPSFPLSLEDLEFEYKREAMELARIRDKEEDEENCKHREALKEIWESRTKKAAALRGTHANMWTEFLQAEGQRRRQEARQQVPASRFGGYKQLHFAEIDTSSGNPYHSADNEMNSRDLITDTELVIGFEFWIQIVAWGTSGILHGSTASRNSED